VVSVQIGVVFSRVEGLGRTQTRWPHYLASTILTAGYQASVSPAYWLISGTAHLFTFQYI
jgi:hypothetical protein